MTRNRFIAPAAVVSALALVGFGVVHSAQAAVDDPALAGKRVWCIDEHGLPHFLNSPCSQYRGMWYYGRGQSLGEPVKGDKGDKGDPGNGISSDVRSAEAKDGVAVVKNVPTTGAHIWGSDALTGVQVTLVSHVGGTWTFHVSTPAKQLPKPTKPGAPPPVGTLASEADVTVTVVTLGAVSAN